MRVETATCVRVLLFALAASLAARAAGATPTPGSPPLAQVQWEEAPAETEPPPTAEPAQPGSAAQAEPPGATAPTADPVPPPPPPYPPPPPPQPDRAKDVDEPAAAAAQPEALRGERFHDGFYLRMSLGVGAQAVAVEFDGPEQNFEFAGGAVGMDLLLGGTPMPGLAIGGLLLLQSGGASTIEVDGAEVEVEARLTNSMLGVFVDAFPEPAGGFHFGGSLGAVSAHLEAGSAVPNESENGSGLGGAVWAGWGGWVGDQWSLGGLGRLFASATRRDIGESTQQERTLAFVLSFSALYH